MAFRDHFLNSLRHTSSTRRCACVRFQVVRSVQELPVVLPHGVKRFCGHGTRAQSSAIVASSISINSIQNELLHYHLTPCNVVWVGYCSAAVAAVLIKVHALPGNLNPTLQPYSAIDSDSSSPCSWVSSWTDTPLFYDQIDTKLSSLPYPIT